MIFHLYEWNKHMFSKVIKENLMMIHICYEDLDDNS